MITGKKETFSITFFDLLFENISTRWAGVFGWGMAAQNFCKAIKILFAKISRKEYFPNESQ